MSRPNKCRILIFAGIVLFTFSAWFADGYFQWVNSDTAGGAYQIFQDIAFPQGLISDKFQHSRFTETIIHYIPFHTLGYLFRELTGNPVDTLYVSQGVMSGTIFLLLVLISSSYVSFSAPIFSSKYLVRATLLMLFIMALPHLPLNSSISLVLRFGHQTITANYVGTMVIALIVVYPYWRYLFFEKWDDWYNDTTTMTAFYLAIIAAVFSNTATMLWLGAFAFMAFFAFIYFNVYAERKNVKTVDALREIVKDPKIHPLMFTMIILIIGVIAESISGRGSSSLTGTHLLEYVKVYFHFFISNGMLLYIIACLLLFAFMIWQHKKGTISSRLNLLARIFPWLLVGNLIFIFFIGMPKIPYRFSGYNLGPDTVFPATWSMTLWLLAVVFECWKSVKLTWVSPFILFALITNSLTFLDFPSHWQEMRERQKNIFSAINHYNYSLPVDITIPIPVENVAFSKDELEQNTLLMLRRMGILSAEREVLVVSQEAYENWHKAPIKNNALLGLENHFVKGVNFVDFSKYSYPDFIAKTAGMSIREAWGRWTDANIEPTAKIHFKDPLPKKFTLEMKVNAFGPNVGVPIKVRVGNVEKTFTLAKKNAELFRLDFDMVKNADTIEIIPPIPTSPLELGGANKDARKLGVGLVYLKILK